MCIGWGVILPAERTLIITDFHHQLTRSASLFDREGLLDSGGVLSQWYKDKRQDEIR